LIHNDNQVKKNAVATFLKNNFLSSHGRYFIFTSHVNSITYKLDIGDRLVHRVELPVFTTVDEVNSVLQQKTDIHPMYYGNSPGLSYTCLTNFGYPAHRIGNFLASKTQISGVSIIKNIFSGFCEELQEFDTIARISSNKTVFIRIWIPVFLQHLFSVAPFTDLSKIHSELASKLLSKLGKDQFHIEYDPDWSDFFPILPSAGTFKITVEYPQENLDNVVYALLVPRSEPSVILSYPQQSAFPLYDIFVAIHSGSGKAEIWGYQCKARDLPTSDKKPHHLVLKSIILRSHDICANTNSNASQNGWKIANENDRNSLLGPTFIGLRLMEEPVGNNTVKSQQKNQGRKEAIHSKRE
jgi:hypothetical protein